MDFLNILANQKEEIENLKNLKLCSRSEESSIDLNSSLAQIVIGVRRSGKSTICHKVLLDNKINYGYINFDDERLSKISSKDLEKLLEASYVIYGKYTHLFIDEIQNIKEWFLFVNRLLRQGLHVLITGSNSNLLSSELSSHLTGRYNQIELFPFSFYEYCDFKNIKKEAYSTKERANLKIAFADYLKEGGFPEISKIQNKKKYISTLFDSIMNRDILYRFKIRYKDALSKIANFIADNFAHEIIPSKVAKEFNIASVHTVENYINYLKEAYLILGLHKFSNKSKERIRNEKYYLVDVAFISDRDNIFLGENFGWRLENIVYLELLRRYKKNLREIFYYKNNCEIDFVVCYRNSIEELIQVSYDISNEKTKKREINALIKGSSDLRCKKLMLLSLSDSTLYKDENGVEINERNIIEWLLDNKDR